jgi:hypothetical protein
MLHLDIAGHHITYRTIQDLQDKAKGILSAMAKSRQDLENQLREHRIKERSLQQFLGGLKSESTNGGTENVSK